MICCKKKINLAIRWAVDELSNIEQNEYNSTTTTTTNSSRDDDDKRGDGIALSSQQKVLLQKIKFEFENLHQKKIGTHAESDKKELSPNNNNNDELAQEVQSIIFNNAKSNNLQPKEVFRLFYQILINSERGPRLGNYIADLGLQNVIATLEKRISTS
jgi:lysyl-tRNA synthetase, class I